MPGGRILFGAGQPRRATLLNCYFFKIKEDSIEAIFDWCKEAARTYSFGGGVGTDISVLRPRGSPVNNSAIYSTGSVSFMELLSTTTGTIGQAGRRGALMITIRVDHPDVLDFISVKKDLKKVNYANISIKMTDEFMKAVEDDTDFELRFKNERVDFRKTVKARTVWSQLVKAAWQSDEPGLLFWDTIKRDSTTEYNDMEVQGVNPCSEQTLENYGCCCLGSVNLSYFVKDAFTERASIDWDGLVQASRYATRFLDNVLDYNAERHPLPQQKQASLWSRRIGVGTTGLGRHADQARTEVRRRSHCRVRRQALRAHQERDLRLLDRPGPGEGFGPRLRRGEAPRAAVHPAARPEGQGEDQDPGDPELGGHDGAARRVQARYSRRARAAWSPSSPSPIHAEASL